MVTNDSEDQLQPLPCLTCFDRSRSVSDLPPPWRFRWLRMLKPEVERRPLFGSVSMSLVISSPSCLCTGSSAMAQSSSLVVGFSRRSLLVEVCCRSFCEKPLSPPEDCCCLFGMQLLRFPIGESEVASSFGGWLSFFS
ncbi:hypothetical protein AALP_AA3G166300 [Arabis alpina]|uniref:Uncharacterized protein n=1 Tax=Arabis alpina TaxID=50452 RepID=A0A087H9N1_ARAAL|nr:hypothetical protein AALP_AA3G166300 [Arabis alpina]